MQELESTSKVIEPKPVDGSPPGSQQTPCPQEPQTLDSLPQNLLTCKVFPFMTQVVAKMPTGGFVFRGNTIHCGHSSPFSYFQDVIPVLSRIINHMSILLPPRFPFCLGYLSPQLIEYCQVLPFWNTGNQCLSGINGIILNYWPKFESKKKDYRIFQYTDLKFPTKLVSQTLDYPQEQKEGNPEQRKSQFKLLQVILFHFLPQKDLEIKTHNDAYRNLDAS